ncbi:MAG: hypothetical protein AAGL24_11015 [Pseudomonadota bacterium]
MALDTLALWIIVGIVAAYVIAMMVGLFAIFPYGLIGLAVLAVVLYFVVRVVRDRLTNTEDDYYEKNIKQ